MVRRPRMQDAEATLRVWLARDIRDTGGPDYVLGDFATPGVDAWVAELDGEIVGSALLDQWVVEHQDGVVAVVQAGHQERWEKPLGA